MLSFFISVILARQLGPADYGIYAFAFSLVTLISVPVKLGLPSLVTRETAKAFTSQEWAIIKGVQFWANKNVLIFSLIVLFLSFAVYFYRGEFNVKDNTIIIACILIPTIALANIRDASMRGLRYVLLSQVCETLLRPFLFLIFCILVFYLYDLKSPVSVITCQVVAAIFSLILGMLLLSKIKPSEIRDCDEVSISQSEWIRAAVPLAFISGMQIINMQSDILILGVFSNPHEVGIYKVIVTISTLVAFGLQAINMVVGPYFASLYHENNINKLQSIVSISSKMTFCIALPIFIILFSFGRELLSIVYGENYALGYIPLVILIAGQLINAFMGSVALLLNMTNHERDTIRGLSISVVSNIILNLLLIPKFGMIGAASSTTVTLFIWNILLRKAALNKLNIETMAFFGKDYNEKNKRKNKVYD